MILVLGGTTEGRRVVTTLDVAGTPYYYSTRGDAQSIVSSHAVRLSGGMNTNQMADFCRHHDIRLLIDAAHPFAINLHRTVEEVSTLLSLPVIRYERQYPPIPSSALVCEDWPDAVNKLQSCKRLLALTGVETIAKLRDYWHHHETWFRILDRESSWQIVRQEQFPADHILITKTTESSDLPALPIDAVITKESGDSGWFDQKVEWASRVGVPLYVVRRPKLPAWPIVTGTHSLRRAVEHCLPSFYTLRSGLTTGSCATAAAVEALRRLLDRDASHAVTILLPDGEEVLHPISRSMKGHATAQKDGGSDPDVTHGCIIDVKVQFTNGEEIDIQGGEGVGRVTLPGLGLPIGSPAINMTPQQMIRTNLRCMYSGGLKVTISVPEGRSIAKRTFNPRVGVVDGISIIGTTGVVHPFSHKAFVEAIRRQMQIAIALHSPMVVLSSGLKSETMVKDSFPQLPPSAFIHYGNLIGDALQAATTLHIQHVALCVMIGKAVKLAAGNLNTHSHEVTMNRPLLATWLAEAGADDAQDIASSINMARELPTVLSTGLWQSLRRIIINKCILSCRKVYPYSLQFFLLEQ